MQPKASKGKAAKSGKSKKGKKSAKSAKSKTSEAPQEDKEVDMMNPHAMENLYYIAHGPVNALQIRGFNWEGGGPKKKGKKGKKKK